VEGGGGFGVDVVVLCHGASAFEVPWVTDDEGRFEALGIHDFFCFRDVFFGAFRVIFREDVFGGDALANAVFFSDFRFCVVGAFAEPTCEDDGVDAVRLVEVDGVVDAGFEDGGGLIVPGSSPENDGAVGTGLVITVTEAVDVPHLPEGVEGGKTQQEQRTFEPTSFFLLR